MTSQTARRRTGHDIAPDPSVGPAGGWVARMLTEGGDERIWLDPATGFNRYGCGVSPDPRAAALGSSTCSTISSPAFEAVQSLAARLRDRGGAEAAYGLEAARLRGELAALCGLRAGDQVVLAASGTDLHLIAADLARAGDLRPLTCVAPDPAETGRGVPAALQGQGFALVTPHGGGGGATGAPIQGMIQGRVDPVRLREPDGTPRARDAIDRDAEAACAQAARAGGRVLLIVVDVSKTGLVAPSPACAARLKARFPDQVEVLVDACQFRLSPDSLTAYLAAGFLVAVTGSKFLGGPPFSGALLVPADAAARLGAHPLSHGLADYCGREDWPDAWAARATLPAAPNPGLLFRWEAALHELRSFRALPPHRVAVFLDDFGEAVGARLDADPAFIPLPSPDLARPDPQGWDARPSIFPFRLRDRAGRPMTAAATEALFWALREGPAPIHLGQPVTVGTEDGKPLTALRLCASARLAVEALGPGGHQDAVIGGALGTLSRIAEAARLA